MGHNCLPVLDDLDLRKSKNRGKGTSPLTPTHSLIHPYIGFNRVIHSPILRKPKKQPNNQCAIYPFGFQGLEIVQAVDKQWRRNIQTGT